MPTKTETSLYVLAFLVVFGFACCAISYIEGSKSMAALIATHDQEVADYAAE